MTETVLIIPLKELNTYTKQEQICVTSKRNKNKPFTPSNKKVLGAESKTLHTEENSTCVKFSFIK